MGSGSRKIGKMRSLAIVLLSAVALSRANPCQNDQDVYFPDREDCGRFYMCRNGGVVGHMNCPDGLLWNTDLLTCDWPRNVECTPGCPEGWRSTLPRRTTPSLVWPRLPGAATTTDLTTGSGSAERRWSTRTGGARARTTPEW